MISKLIYLANYAGTLRTILGILTLVLIGMAPFASAPTETTGWPLITTIVAPSFFVMMLFLLPLDMMMTLIFMSDREGAARQRLKWIAIVEGGLMLILVLAWLPIVLRLLGVF